MFLIPGDSPMGLRLPLESIQWVPPEQRDEIYERDPLEQRDERVDASAQTNSQNTSTTIDAEDQKFFIRHFALNSAMGACTSLCLP